LTFNDKLIKLLNSLMENVVVLLGLNFDLLRHNVIPKGLGSSRELLIPVACKINEVTLVNWDHPIVREVFVDNLSHLCILIFKNLWHKAKQDEDDLSLLSKSDRSVLWVRVGGKLAIDIVVLYQVNQVLS